VRPAAIFQPQAGRFFRLSAATREGDAMDATLGETSTFPLKDTLQMPEKPPGRRSGTLGDVVFSALTRAAALITLLLLAGIIASLVVGAWPSIREFGLGFLVNA
jgi:hypothetical protein